MESKRSIVEVERQSNSEAKTLKWPRFYHTQNTIILIVSIINILVGNAIRVGKNHDFFPKNKKIGFFLFKSDFFDLNQIMIYIRIFHFF